jgi:hypothetical protein
MAAAATLGALRNDAIGQRRPTQLSNAVLFRGGDAPIRVGQPAPHTGRGTSNDCAACHREIAREWAASLHKGAWTDDVFQSAYQIEPMEFCRNCHAPLSPRGHTPRGLAASEGVSCAACHVRDGMVLSSGAGRGDAEGTVAPHPVRADARFGRSEYCAGCHQFNFPAERSPGGPLFDTHMPMQDTFGEWQRSDHARRGTQCQDCHMPWRTAADGTRYRSHAFVGGRDPSLLSRSARVEVRATRTADRRVAVRATVVPTDVGHAFPTGDLFRRLELSVWLDDDPSRRRTISFSRSFADQFERRPDGTSGFVRRQAADSRVQPPGTGEPRVNRVSFPVAPDSSPRVVRWKFEHLLMPSPQAASQGFGPARYRSTISEGVAPIESESVDAGVR